MSLGEKIADKNATNHHRRKHKLCTGLLMSSLRRKVLFPYGFFLVDFFAYAADAFIFTGGIILIRTTNTLAKSYCSKTLKKKHKFIERIFVLYRNSSHCLLTQEKEKISCNIYKVYGNHWVCVRC